MKHFPEPEKMQNDALKIGIYLLSDEIQKFIRYELILLQYSEKYNLIGPGEKERLWSRHFLESLAFESLLKKNEPVVDIGSGAGFPGIVLAIRGYIVSLIEPRRKKYLFLEHVVKELELKRVDILRTRVENFRIDRDVCFVSRAVAPPEKLMKMIERSGTARYNLITRSGERNNKMKTIDSVILPSPPLDRRGILEQFRQNNLNNNKNISPDSAIRS